MRRYILELALLLSSATLLHTQTIASTGDSITSAGSSVPIVMKFNANLQPIDGKAASGLRGLTFSLYRDQTGGAPLWIETQSVAVDARGWFTALLGATLSGGIPADIFVSGEPRWIGITPEDEAERPRILLASVPYAFKSADSDTLSGKRAEDFVSLEQLKSMLKIGLTAQPGFETPMGLIPIGSTTAIGSGQTIPLLNVDAEFLHGFSDSAFAKLGDKNIFAIGQSFPGGIELPASSAEVGNHSLMDSASLDLAASAPDPATAVGVEQRFRWLAQPPALSSKSRLSLFFGSNRATPIATGLSINSDGTINFAPNQQLPSSAVATALSESQNGAGTSAASQPAIVETTPYSWNSKPLPQPLHVGPNTVTFSPCPKGVNGSDQWHYFYISGTGTPEVVVLTGGSCVSGASGGTLEFQATHDHPIGYTIGTTTDGVQEAVVAATMAGGQSRQVLIDPGTHLFRARLSVRATGMILSNSGGLISCAMTDTCIMLGDPSNTNLFTNISLQGLRVSPQVQGGTWTAVEDNANSSVISDFGTGGPNPHQSNSFGSLIQIDNDQAATIDHLDTNMSAWARCDATFCSTAIVGPGPYNKNAGKITVQNSNLSLGCAANGIDNEDGNFLSVQNTVIQAYPQFGVRARTVFIAPTVALNGVHEEIGNCVNPLGTGMAGLIVGGGTANVTSTVGPTGQIPEYANNGGARFFYYIVVHSDLMGTSPLYYAGNAISLGPVPIPVVWNKVGTAGDITYDVLRITGDGGAATVAPYGIGSFAVATGIPASSCGAKVCSILDNAMALPSSYTVSTNTTYWPALWMWPGGTILTTPLDYMNTGGGLPTQLTIDQLGSSVSTGGVVNSAGASQPSVFAGNCDVQDVGSPIWIYCPQANAYSNDNPNIVGTIFQLAGVGTAAGRKGRLSFVIPPGGILGATHLFTFVDSNPEKSLASPMTRAPWDANDAYIGSDNPADTPVSLTHLSIGAPVSISQYIAKVGNGKTDVPGERLTASLKQFNVPVVVPQLLTGSSDNTDDAGTLVISGGTSASYSFSNTKQSVAPSCELTPHGDTTDIGTWWETITTTTLTANVKTAGSISFSYQCWGHTAN